MRRNSPSLSQTLAQRSGSCAVACSSSETMNHSSWMLSPKETSPQRKFGGAAPAAARILRMQVPAMEQINPAGVDAMCKVCSTLQPVLTALGATADALGAQSQQAGQQFDATRTYYGLLKMPVDSFIKFARERPHRYFASEYFAVLDVLVPGRAVTEEHRAQLEKVLGRKKGRKANVTRDALRPERRVNSGSGALDGATSLTLMERLARERSSEKAAEVAAEHRLERPQRQTAQR
mmetsp:Transcript_12071/g.30481  ORF Transcript_12071/g.30481 Transcript_12071/m.30481 type:complete len:235 (+) Transcript_12071:638-1342(+)